MTAVVGNIEMADEGMHLVEDHPQFNESALLTMFDAASGAGGYLRIGNRPNEGHAESTLCWFLPDGRALFRFDRATIDSNERFDTGAITIDLVEPGRLMKAKFRGPASVLASPRLLTEGGRALKEARAAEVEMDLTLEGLSPIYGACPFPGLDVGGHYEQHMAITGTLSIDGETHDVRAFGNRDHSWGPRVWQGTVMDRTLWCTFDREFGFATSLTWKSTDESVYEVIGYVWRGDDMVKVVDGRVETEFEDADQLFHTALDLTLDLEDGTQLEVSGRVKAMAPLRNRRDGRTTHIGWAMAEFASGGRAGFGLSEYLDLR